MWNRQLRTGLTNRTATWEMERNRAVRKNGLSSLSINSHMFNTLLQHYPLSMARLAFSVYWLNSINWTSVAFLFLLIPHFMLNPMFNVSHSTGCWCSLFLQGNSDLLYPLAPDIVLNISCLQYFLQQCTSNMRDWKWTKGETETFKNCYYLTQKQNSVQE